MEFGSFDGEGTGQITNLGLVEISKIFVTYAEFFHHLMKCTAILPAAAATTFCSLMQLLQYITTADCCFSLLWLCIVKQHCSNKNHPALQMNICQISPQIQHYCLLLNYFMKIGNVCGDLQGDLSISLI